MRGRRVWLLSVSLADLLFLYLPIGVLILFSFNASRLSATWQGNTAIIRSGRSGPPWPAAARASRYARTPAWVISCGNTQGTIISP